MNAPRLLTVKIDPAKIGLLIGPGGKMIRSIQDETGAKLDIGDDGTVNIAHVEGTGAEEAKRRVEALCQDVSVGSIYDGKVSSIKEFGAFIEITPGRDGLCHVSELDSGFVSRVEDIVRVGDRVQVKVIGIDDQNRIKLSRKALMPPAPGGDENGGGRPEREPAGDRGGDRGGDRNGGGRGRGPRRDRD